MPITEARRKANEKYNAKAYDEIKVRVSKGRKAELQAHADQRGESLNGFIGRAIEEQAKRDTGITSVGSDSPMILILPETLETATQAANATGENIPAFIARAVQTQAKRDQTSIDFGINPSTGETINRREGK